jgi:hypothetical protein
MREASALRCRPSTLTSGLTIVAGSAPTGAACSGRAVSKCFTYVYRVLVSAARAEAIGQDRLADFLSLEYGGEYALARKRDCR